MIAILLGAWWVVMLAATAGTVVFWRNAARRVTATVPDGVVLVIPIKGHPDGVPAIRELLDRCLVQLGPRGRMVVALSDEGDPAAPAVAAAMAADPRLDRVLAGRAEGRGQKVHNLLAALRTLRNDDRFVVFADADLVPAADWLAQLLRPLALGRAPLSSGYRWILPDDGRWPSRFAALIDWSIATTARSRRWNLCWGGSTAITRTALDTVDLQRRWSGALLDDLVLTRAARQNGLAIHTPHRVLMPTPVRHGWHSLFAFGRRQYLLVRVHMPRHWCLAGATLILPVLGVGAASFAGWFGLASVGAALVLQQVRAVLRARIAAAVLEPDIARRSAAAMRRDRWLLPFAHLVHLALWASSAFGRTTVWAGIRYRLIAPDRVELLDPRPD